MIVKIESPIATFDKWKAMVHSNSEKIKKYGMTFLSVSYTHLRAHET